MKISVNVNGAPVADKERFAYLKECGFEACDIKLDEYFGVSGVFADIDNVTDAQIKDYFTELKNCAKDAKIEIGQTRSQFTGNLADYEGGLEDVIKREIACIKATKYLGAKYCVIAPVVMEGRRYDLLVSENFNAAAKFYKELIPTLEACKVTGCIENMWTTDPVSRYSCATILSRASELNKMVKKLGENYKICLDIGHCALTADNPVDVIKAVKDNLVCMHIHDNNGWSDLHAIPYGGFGKPVGLRPIRIDWPTTLAAIKESGYKGNINFDIVPPGPVDIRKDGYLYLADIGKYFVSVIKG